MNYLFMNVIVLAGLFMSFIGKSVSSARVQVNSDNQALLYLAKFGYVDPRASNPESGAMISAAYIREAIIAFQNFAGLNQTGVIDEETSILMNTPRCGVKDKIGFGSNARKKRYALQGSRWKIRHLAYKITKYPKHLSKKKVDHDIKRAFKVWSDVTELTFQAVISGKVHIEIRFEKAEHGDGDPFDGPGGTLAHAYFPIYGGDAHFDDSETWTVNSKSGTNLFQVSAHEFGHSLGLSHSDVRSALMAPFYRGYQSRFDLDHDDITAIQSLYGVKSPEMKPYVPPQKPSSYPSGSGGSSGDDSILCKNGKFDAITTMQDNKTYVFKDSQYWKLTDSGVAKGYPKRITREFRGLPSHIDAVFTWTNGKTYFFKGSNYYRFTDFTLDETYPKSISKGFAGIPNNIDSAFVWSGNGKIYFFKNKDYYKFDPTKTPAVEDKYPKDIDLWEGIPYYIDGAMQYYNGYTYFFKNGKYWRFNDRRFKVDSHAKSPFPRPVGSWWFGCSEKGSQVTATTEDSEVNDSAEQPTVSPFSRGDNYSPISDNHIDDIYNKDSDYNPKSGGFSTSSNSNPASSVPSATLTWLIIPLVLKYICH